MKWKVYYLIVAGIAFIVTISVYYVYSRVRTIELGYQISNELEKHNKLLSQNQKLVIEYNSLKSPDRVINLARDHFGLNPPRPEQIFNVDKARMDVEKDESNQR